jgi:hypothetical protein
MKTRVVIPTASGELISYDITGANAPGQPPRIVFSTSEESFERWLFYLLRDIGAHVVSDDPAAFRHSLGLGDHETGVIDESRVGDMLLNRHPATT